MFEITILKRKEKKTSQLLESIINFLKTDSNFDNLTSKIISENLGVTLDQKIINEIMNELGNRIQFTEYSSAFDSGFAGDNGWTFCMTSSGIESIENLLFAVKEEETKELDTNSNTFLQINNNDGDVNNISN